jgi:hypothetical protein
MVDSKVGCPRQFDFADICNDRRIRARGTGHHGRGRSAAGDEHSVPPAAGARAVLCGSVSCRERATLVTLAAGHQNPQPRAFCDGARGGSPSARTQRFGSRRSARGPALCGSVSCRELATQVISGGRSSEPTARPSVLHRRPPWICVSNDRVVRTENPERALTWRVDSQVERSPPTVGVDLRRRDRAARIENPGASPDVASRQRRRAFSTDGRRGSASARPSGSNREPRNAAGPGESTARPSVRRRGTTWTSSSAPDGDPRR